MTKNCICCLVLRFIPPRVWILLICLLLVTFECISQEQPNIKISDETKSQVTCEVLEQLTSKYVFPEVAAQMAKAIRSHAANMNYVNIASARQFAERLQTDLRRSQQRAAS